MIEPTDIIDDDIRLYRGDCRPLLSSLTGIDAVITDPPYGIGVEPATRRPSNYQRKAGMLPRDWDNEPADVSPLLGLAEVVVLWGGNYYILPPSRCWFVWHKPDAPPSMSNVELAWTNREANSRQFAWTTIHSSPTKPIRLIRWDSIPPNFRRVSRRSRTTPCDGLPAWADPRCSFPRVSERR